MSQISQDDLQKIFHNLDKNKDGHVSIHELHHLLDMLGIHTTLDDLERFVGRTELDYMDFFFFYEAMIKARMADQDQEKDLFKAFKVFDLDCDGYISSEELERVLARLGLWDKRNGQDCKQMISKYDDNSDGVLDFEEFKNMMSSSPPTSDSDL